MARKSAENKLAMQHMLEQASHSENTPSVAAVNVASESHLKGSDKLLRLV